MSPQCNSNFVATNIASDPHGSATSISCWLTAM